MFKLPEKIKNDIQGYKNSLNKYLAGELKDGFLRGIRVPWGNYSQRGGKLLMSRLRIPAGILTPQQLNAIGIAAKNYADGKLHITTRQDIQIHNVPYQNSIKIIEYLKDFDISPRGGGGNTVRNITACYLSGVCPFENTEVYKISWGLSEYLLSIDESYNLPRKLKIAFSGCKKDCAYTGVNDVGFVALDDGFKVIVGGGMGAKSNVGKVLQKNVDAGDIGYIVKTIINLFNTYGDRKNRHHNRLRFLIEDIGWERFVSLYRQELTRVKETEYIAIRVGYGLPELPLPNKDEIIHPKELGNNEYKLFLKYNTGQQKQNGYFYVQLRISCGETDSETLIRLSELSNILARIIFRMTPRQNIIISNVPRDKIYTVFQKVKSVLGDFLFPETCLDIVSCKAATTCNLGICNALGLVPEVVNALKNRDLDIDQLKDIKINVNGCPNACGHHPIGTLSLAGMARKVYGKTVPFYKIFLEGKIDAENTKLAEEIGIIPARVIPKLITEFISSKIRDRYLMSELMKKYSFVPTYEEDKSYYFDFGKQEEFSLEGLTQGECGAGVIDMIESDLESARQSLLKSKENSFDLKQIRNALVYSARALLVVKGIDPKDEKQTIVNFIDKFINTMTCSSIFSNIDKIYSDIISDNIQKRAAFDYVSKFFEEVEKIYSSMDSNFNFPIKSKDESLEIVNILPSVKSVIYDLRGIPCPINYVKTKLKLEELKLGDILEVYLDEGEPIQNVPKSLESDGQEIIKVEQAENFFKVLIKKKI
jgi:sulfite reductase (ferredoxin)